MELLLAKWYGSGWYLKKRITDWWNNTHLSFTFVHGGTTQHQSCLPNFYGYGSSNTWLWKRFLLLAGGTACIFSRLCPIFTMVCSTYYFSALQTSRTLLGIIIFMNKFTFSFLFSLVPLAGRNFKISERKQFCRAITI